METKVKQFPGISSEAGTELRQKLSIEHYGIESGKQTQLSHLRLLTEQLYEATVFQAFIMKTELIHALQNAGN